MMTIRIPSRFSLLVILFLAVSPFVLSQSGFIKDEPATTTAGKESPRFFGARLGALPIVRQSIARGETSLMPAFETLLKTADEALATKPPTVTDKKRHPVTGNLNDYYTQAPYLWPDPSKPDGLPYLPKDGIINPESRNPDFTCAELVSVFQHLITTINIDTLW